MPNGRGSARSAGCGLRPSGATSRSRTFVRSSARRPASRSSPRPGWARRGCSTSSHLPQQAPPSCARACGPTCSRPSSRSPSLRAGCGHRPSSLRSLAHRAPVRRVRPSSRSFSAPSVPLRPIPRPSASSSSRPGSRVSTRSGASAQRCGWSRTSTGPRPTCSHFSSSPEAPRGTPDASSWRVRDRSCSTSGGGGGGGGGGSAPPAPPPRETEELVRELVGEALPADLVARVAERSAGNPLFVEELLRTWAAVGILAAEEAGWRLAAPAEEVELPLTVQAIYAAQLDDLPPPARAAARRAAVAGRRFPREALALFEVEEPDAALDTLVRRSLVSAAEEDVLLGPSHSYRHALLRDAGYASLARAERARLHVRLAEWLPGGAPRAPPARPGGHPPAPP